MAERGVEALVVFRSRGDVERAAKSGRYEQSFVACDFDAVLCAGANFDAPRML